MSQINIRNLCNENEDGAPTIVGVSTFSATSYMCPPKGTTAQRPENPVSGSLRFNTDTASLEYYRGNTLGWTQIEMTSPDLDGGARGVRAGGQTPSGTDIIDYFTISTLGNAIDFGNLSGNRFGVAPGASRTRGMFMGGATPTRQDTIEYITISSTGDATDFGNLSTTMATTGSSSQTRAFTMGGDSPGYINNIEYVTIASTGNSEDFGDMSTQDFESFRVTSSSTRAVTTGGYTSPTFDRTMEYITIASQGNSIDFGEMTRDAYAPGAGGNSTRGIIAGGYTPSDQSDIDYITIATLGNSTDWGADLVTSSSGPLATASDPTRLCIFGHTTSAGNGNVIQYLQIASTGVASADFGDLTGVCTNAAGFSNAHGGL